MPEYYDKLKEFGSVLKSECRSVWAEEIYNRLKRAGFAHIEELKAKGMDYDHGYYQRKNDSYSEHKYGEGQLRLVVTKGMSKEKRT